MGKKIGTTNMTIRQVMQENIVEEIDLYRDIYKDFVSLIRTVDENYNSRYSFDEFYIKILDNFEGVDEDYDTLTRQDYIKRLYNSLTKISKEELKFNKKFLQNFDKIIEKEGYGP